MVQTSFFLMLKQLIPKKEVIWSIVSIVNFINRKKVAENIMPATQVSGKKSLFVDPAT